MVELFLRGITPHQDSLCAIPAPSGGELNSPEASPKQLAQGEDYVLYAIVDFIADNYLTVVEKLADEIEALEDHVLEPLEEGRIYRIYELRRELQRLRLAAAPAVEVFSRLEHADLPGIDKVFQPYFRDVGDHVRRALEQIDMLREMLGFAFEAGMLMESSEPGGVTPERHQPPACRMGRDFGGADRCRRLLRHELRKYAGAALALRLSGRAPWGSDCLLHPVRALPQGRVDLSGEWKQEIVV